MNPAWPQHQLPNHVLQNEWNEDKGYDPSSDIGPRRTYPAEKDFIQYDPITRVWCQGGNRVSSRFRPKHYWTRPHDGKRSGAWGRLKDALTNEGADVFITTSGDKRTLMRDRPQKWMWTGWPESHDSKMDRWMDPDWRMQDFMVPRELSWTQSSSRAGAQYNFKTRKYEVPWNGWGDPKSAWRDAQWRPGAKRSDSNPLSHQTADEVWWSRVPWDCGEFAGGRPRHTS